jgi:hypothetical protein
LTTVEQPRNTRQKKHYQNFSFTFHRTRLFKLGTLLDILIVLLKSNQNQYDYFRIECFSFSQNFWPIKWLQRFPSVSSAWPSSCPSARGTGSQKLRPKNCKKIKFYNSLGYYLILTTKTPKITTNHPNEELFQAFNNLNFIKDARS